MEKKHLQRKEKEDGLMIGWIVVIPRKEWFFVHSSAAQCEIFNCSVLYNSEVQGTVEQ